MQRERLIAHRKALQLSQREMARRVGVDRSTYMDWEAGITAPRPASRRRLASFLELTSREVDELFEDPAGDRTAMLDRAAGGGRIGAGVLTAVCSLTDELRRLDDQAGGGAVLPFAEAHVDLIGRLITHGSYMPSVGEQLHHAYSDVAELAGWVAYDAGELPRSERHYALSLNAAHSSGDPLMVTHSLTMMAFGARYTPDPDAHRTLDAAEASIPAGRRYDGVRALVAAWRMFDHAARRDARGFETSFADASRWYERSRRDDWPAWMYWLWHPERMADTGHALNLIGEHQRAVEVLTEGEKLAVAWPRDHVLYLTFLGEAHDGLHDRDAASHHRRRAVELMGDEIVSGRLATMLQAEERA